MIHSLYKLSKYISENEIDNNPLGLNLNHKEGIIYFLKFDVKEDKSKKITITYTGIDFEEYDIAKNRTCYLYKSGGGNFTSDFPTVSIFKIDDMCDNGRVLTPETKIGKKFLRILKNNSNINPKLNELYTTFKNYCQDNVFNELESKFEKGILLSIKLNEEYIGKSTFYENVKKQAESELYKSYYQKGSGLESKATNKCCNICNKKTSEVWGFASTFNFYATTELAALAGGFKQKNTWKNYPVCPECIIALEKARNFLDKNFRFNFYGYNYYLIPSFIFEHKDNEEIIEIFKDNISNDLKSNILKRGNNITNDENEVFNILQKTKNNASYTMFFYKEKNSEFKILLSIDHVFPSRFRKLFEAKKKAENRGINTFFEKLKGIKKNELADLEFRFGTLKNFYIYEDKNNDGFNNKVEFEKDFLEIVRAIFIDIKIDYYNIINKIMHKIRPKFNNDVFYNNDVLNAILLIKFLFELNLFKEIKKSIEKEIKLESIYNDFFAKHSEFFDSNTKKAVFLTGVLSQKLLNIQYAERNTTPFRERLNGMKISEKIIKRLIPELINKLEEYNKNYYKEIETIISHYLLEAKFLIPNDEISFFFTMGMTLHKEFTAKEEGNNKGEEE